MNLVLRPCIASASMFVIAIAATGCKKQPSASTPSANDTTTTSSQGSANAADEYLAIHDALPHDLLIADPGQGEALKTLLNQHAADIQRLVEATRREECDFHVDYAAGLDVVLPHLPSVRGLGRLLKADAERALAANDLDGGAQRAAAIFRLGKHTTAHAQSMIEWLVGSSIALLGTALINEHSELARAAWKTDIQTAIGELTPNNPLGLKRVLEAERAVSVRSVREGKIPDMSSAGGHNWPNMPQAERDTVALKLDSLWARTIEAWDAPDATTRLNSLITESKNSPAGEIFVALDKIREVATKTRDELNQASATLAK